jgi:hydroxymethylpyrimidine/phosphomethylpyrimidine kinase
LAPDLVGAQIDAVLGDICMDAIKIGMLADPEIVNIVAEKLAGFEGPIVLDPVMVAKSGVALLSDSAVQHLIDQLIPLATVLTPNLPEAARLVNRPMADTGRGHCTGAGHPGAWRGGGGDERRAWNGASLYRLSDPAQELFHL